MLFSQSAHRIQQIRFLLDCTDHSKSPKSMKFANICLSSHLYVCGYCKNHYFECLELEELIHHGLTCPCYGPKHYIPVSFHKCKGPGCGYITYSVSEMFRHRDRDQGCVFQSAPDEVHAVWALSLTPTIQNCGATTCVQVAHCLPVFLADDNR